MERNEALEKARKLSGMEIRELPYEEFVEMIDVLSADEIIEISNKVGYPVFTRKCMGKLQHKFVLLQDGAAAIIVNEQGQILMQSRADRDMWGLPGGCQELGETMEETVVREVKEETNLDVREEDLTTIGVISGPTRRSEYPNGDVVINNTVLFLIDKYQGEVKFNQESKDMKFFDLDNIPENQHDPDLVEAYKKYLVKTNKRR